MISLAQSIQNLIHGPGIEGIAEEAWLKERLARDGDPVEIHDFIKLIHGTGNARFYGCKLAAATFDVAETDLVPEAAGIVDSGWFLNEKAIKAAHCQYF